jgi:uncharacterized protein (TIGR03437 family)
MVSLRAGERIDDSLVATETAVLRMKLAGANPQAQVEGLGRLPGKSNYFIGSNPDKWRINIPHYTKLQYRDAYPGINLIYYGNHRQLEYDLVVAPGADPKQINLAFEGARQMRIDANGDLVLLTTSGEIRQHQPVIYQEVGGIRQAVSGHYALKGERAVGFEVGEYDPDRTLIIDPVVSYSTYLGGSNTETGNGIALDPSGNVYLTGTTSSTNFPSTSGAFQSALGGGDIFVTKINAAGTAILYSAYFGGSNSDVSYGIAVDAVGQAYVTGATASSDFPATPGALRAIFAGGEAFVAKLSASGDSLHYATYLGGSRNEIGYGIAVDANGQAHVSGFTVSSDLPVTAGSFQTTFGTGSADAFVTKLNASGSTLLYCTYLGGSGTDEGRSITLDTAGNAYVAGNTNSTNFPTATGAFQTTSGGNFDIFITKLNPTGTALGYSTYLGGGSADRATGIAIDTAGNVYVTGDTASSNSTAKFPTTPNAFQSTFGGGSPASDAFVTKLNANGSGLIYSTYLGGSGTDKALGIAVDSAGQAYMTGSTFSAIVSANNFPTTPGTFQAAYRGNIDAFVTKLNTSGTALIYSTYLGVGGNEVGAGIALDSAGYALVMGNTSSANFPTTPNVSQPTSSGGQEIFITKLGPDGSNSLASVSAASFSEMALAKESIVSAFGANLATNTEIAAAALALSLAGTTVKVKDSLGVERSAPLFFVSQTQINYLIPAGTANGVAAVTVIGADGAVSLGTVQIASVGPGLFAANADGKGVAAAVAVRVKTDGAQIYEPVIQSDGTKWVSRPLDLGPAGEIVVLLLYGTGIRGRSSPAAVTAKIGGVSAQVDYAGPQPDFAGLDQINVRLPRELAGRGEVDVVLTVDGQVANTVRVNIR